ncbi:hypothetical protein [Polaribacter staleyi]|uniref:hypothetical protein n=1 Tax=Polaribacter staleyi TaxID=2022337 RepID=UPI0031BA0ED2
MGKKVFRIHNQGALINDWFASTPINAALIDSIDTDGGNGKKLPTSIPSPFARIDLVRTAFNIIGNSGQLDGIEKMGKAVASDNHKLISDALDIGQIIFNYDKYKDDLEFIAWDKTTSLSKLLSGNEQQRHLGNTLDLFLKQDALQYNFNDFDKIYIIKYKHIIIGGTSPRTLFFAAPNATEIDIKFGNDTMLDEGLHPLYKRDKEYVKYLYALSKTTNFNSKFPEFNSYLIKSFEEIHSIDGAFYNELMNINTDQYLDSLPNVFFNGKVGQPIEVIRGLLLKQYVLDPIKIQDNSDLTIVTTKVNEGYKPLVLPVEPLNLRYKYTLDSWNATTIVPVEDSRPLSKRTLPEQGDLYPYLTMNDFLANTIIKLPYEIDKGKFFTVGENKYLLPLTKRFFDYFSVDDILNKNMIELNSRAGDSVEIKINIPIKKGVIQYSKIYYPNDATDPKKGKIVEKPFAFSIYPFVFSEEVDITYALGLADVMPENGNTLNLKVFNSKQKNESVSVHQKQRSVVPYITTQTIVEDRFDTILIKYGDYENYLIPTWSNYNGKGGDDYEFSIDFGTTNSHIEYKIEGQGSEKAFDISEKDMQIAFLMPNDTPKRSEAIRTILDGESHLKQEVISKYFGENELRNAPFRTCLVQNKDVNYSMPTFVFADANAAFDYEKVAIRKYLKAFTDLKWANNKVEDNARLAHYIEELLLLCKGKVLSNNGNISNTKVTWFYPVSMSSAHLGRLRKIWQKSFKKVFGNSINENNLIDYPESVAPFYYYKAKEGLMAMARPSVSIDIGGGTTDIMIYADGEPKLISSFRFAGNSIFGDGFNGNINSNGFVNKYYSEFKDILIQNDLKAEVEILEKLFNENQTSQDLINFFFSLDENKNIKDKKLNNLNFSEKLAGDSDLKIIFLLFYSSIIYHIAELMKAKNLEAPRNIVFSGTGSKTIQILDQDTKKYSSLKRLFEAIFNNVFKEDDVNIIVKGSDNPKEVTCKGGFYMDSKIDNLNHTELIEVNVGSKETVIQKLNTVSQTTIKYKDLSKDYLKGVVNNVEEFYKLFNKLMTELNFKDSFDISNKSVEKFNKIKSLDLLDYEMQGIENLKSDSTEEDPLGETLFFFPLIGKLNELANEISNE